MIVMSAFSNFFRAKVVNSIAFYFNYSKLIKVFQYSFVIIAEYHLMRFVLKAKRGTHPSEDELKDWYTRMRKMGSGLSTARMTLRLGGWIGAIKFFVEQFRKYISNEKLGTVKEFVVNILDLIGGIADNVYLFYRIGCFKWKSERQELRWSRASTVPTIIIYTLQIITEFINCLNRAKREKKPLSEVVWDKRNFFIMKFSEYPM